MSRYLEIARASMRERQAEVLEPDAVDSRREYEINEIRTAEPAPPSRPSDEPGPEPAHNRWPERTRPPLPLRRCGSLVCRACGAHSPSPHSADCPVPRFETCRSCWFWLSSHGAIKCCACDPPASLSLAEAWVLAREDEGQRVPQEIFSMLHVKHSIQ